MSVGQGETILNHVVLKGSTTQSVTEPPGQDPICRRRIGFDATEFSVQCGAVSGGWAGTGWATLRTAVYNTLVSVASWRGAPRPFKGVRLRNAFVRLCRLIAQETQQFPVHFVGVRPGNAVRTVLYDQLASSFDQFGGTQSRS
jgi:hypothetical protein